MDLRTWTPRPLPPRVGMRGRYASLEPLTPEHIPALREAHCEDETGAMWTYLPVGPFETEADYEDWVRDHLTQHDPMHFSVRMEDGRLGGTLALMRMNPFAGSIETGWLTFAPRLQRTREATEAIYLLMKWCFKAGYRRFEWKCDASNLASRRAAERFGFSFEGVFRQAAVVKGRNRDTAWFACIDSEWPALSMAFETWLSPENFDADGRQVQRLGDLTGPVLVSRDPALISK